MCTHATPPQEIEGYSATFDAYHVVHEDGVHRWYKEAMLGDKLLAEWHAFLAKRQRVDSFEATLKEQRLETVSEALRKLQSTCSGTENRF